MWWEETSPVQWGNCSRNNHCKRFMMKTGSSVQWGEVTLADKAPIRKLKGSKFLASTPLTQVCVCSLLSHVWLSVTPWTASHQAPLSVEFSRQEYWSGLLYSPRHIGFPSPGVFHAPSNASQEHPYSSKLSYFSTRILRSIHPFCNSMTTAVDTWASFPSLPSVWLQKVKFIFKALLVFLCVYRPFSDLDIHSRLSVGPFLHVHFLRSSEIARLRSADGSDD